MNTSEKITVVVYVIISLVIIVVLSVKLSKKKNCKSEPFKKCICQGGRGDRTRVCQDTKEVEDAYNNGLTENSDLVHPGWNTVSPGDMNYPINSGCA